MRRITLLIASMALMVLLVATAALAVEKQCREGQRCEGTDENDRLEGTNANDNIFGFGGADVILGFGGDDNLFGGGGDDFIAGGDGDDDISGGRGDDELRGQAGNDAIRTGDGTDVVRAGQGNDFIDAFDPAPGTNRDDDPDTILCGAGFDRVYADPNDDVVTEGTQACEQVIFGPPPDNFFALNQES